MIIRNFRKEDYFQIRSIYERHYKEEYNFPDFTKNYLTSYVIERDDGKIVTVGGIRLLAEAVTFTDMSLPMMTRAKALQKMLEVDSLIAKEKGFNELYVFNIDDKYNELLQRIGFAEPRANCLVVGI